MFLRETDMRLQERKVLRQGPYQTMYKRMLIGTFTVSVHSTSPAIQRGLGIVKDYIALSHKVITRMP